MTIFSLTPDYDIANVGGFPDTELQIHDHRFIGHIGDLLSLLLRLDVMFHDSPINISNNIIEYRLKEILVRPVPGNHDQVCNDISQAIDHLEFLRSNGARMTPEGLTGFDIPYRDILELNNMRYQLLQMRSRLSREIIFEECPDRMRAHRWGNGLKEVFGELAQLLATYRSKDAVKNHPWTDDIPELLERIRIERVAEEKANAINYRHQGLDDLLLPKYMENAPNPEFPRDEVRLDLSAFAYSPEQLTGLAEKAKQFGAEYRTYDKGVILTYIPFRNEFEEGVPDE